MLNVIYIYSHVLTAESREMDCTNHPRLESPFSLSLGAFGYYRELSHLDTPFTEPTHQVTQHKLCRAEFLTGTAVHCMQAPEHSSFSSEPWLCRSWKYLLILLSVFTDLNLVCASCSQQVKMVFKCVSELLPC